MDALIRWAATPTPTPTVDPDNVTPGVAGFIAIAVVAIAVVLLLVDMLRRIRRARYRSEVGEDLDAELEALRDQTPPDEPGADDPGATPPARG